MTSCGRLLAALLVAAGLGLAASQAPVAEEDLAYRVDELGPWPVDASLPAMLRTPQSALEAFMAAAREERFEDAARVLNLSDLPRGERRERAPALAEKLHFVLEQRLDIDWRGLPDRPDGANDLPDRFGAEGDGAAEGGAAPRRNLLVGLVDRGDVEAEIRLERVQAPGLPPVWLVARSTVRSIDALYERHGPGWLERIAPDWALTTFRRAPLWQWVGLAVLAALSAGTGVLLQRLAARLMTSSDRRWLRGVAGEVARPLAALGGLTVLWLATTTLLTLTGPLARWVTTILAVLVVMALTWLGMSAINFFSEYVGKDHIDHIAQHDERRARRHLTYLSVARRAFIFLVLVLGLGIVLAQFSAFRTVGASLLASAGVAGIVLGIAAQGSLANVMAGIQIALTQLVRIGDTVYFEGEWGYIEDITYTFVIVRTWDQRRIAVPNKHIIANPLENWEMTSSHLIMSVVLYVDYRTPVEALRERYVELLSAADAWDREIEPSLQVIGVTEDVLQLRVLCSAEDALTAWTLHCWLREQLVAHLRDWEGGRYLPRRRLQVGRADPLPAARG